MNRYASALYQKTPSWAQNALLSAYAFALGRQRYGGRYTEYRQFLEGSQRWTPAEMGEYQDVRLRAVVAAAYREVPYYRRRFDELRLTPADIRGRADLPKIPLLTKDLVRRHFDELRSTTVSRGRLLIGHTSGTTGMPLTVGYDRDTVWMTYAVFDRHYSWAGLRMASNGDRIAVARGNVIVPLDQRRPPFWRFNWAQNQMLLSSFHLSKTNLPEYVDALRAFGPTVLDGYPSTLYLIARYLQSVGQILPLRAAVTSSETLYDFQRCVIESQFRCRVFDYYALAERTVFSGECERHEGHHLAMEYGIAEILDRDQMPARPGEVGQLVGTSLHNTAMPLIRYVTNDRTAIRQRPCSCGRSLDLMDDVTTKAEDVLTLRDGRLISPSVLTHPFKPLDCIEGSQIVQTAPDAITVKLVPGEGYNATLEAHLVGELKARLGDDVSVNIAIVDALDVSPNGKFKWVTSHVPLGL